MAWRKKGIMEKFRLILGASALLGSFSLAFASEKPIANLFQVSGKILVDSGKGFVASGDRALQLGDRIFIGDKSSVTVAYADCTVTLNKPSVFIIGKIAPCAKGVSTAENNSVMITPARDAPPGAGIAGAHSAGAAGVGAGAGGAGGFGGFGPLLLLGPAIGGAALIILTASKS